MQHNCAYPFRHGTTIALVQGAWLIGWALAGPWLVYALTRSGTCALVSLGAGLLGGPGVVRAVMGKSCQQTPHAPASVSVPLAIAAWSLREGNE